MLADWTYKFYNTADMGLVAERNYGDIPAPCNGEIMEFLFPTDEDLKAVYRGTITHVYHDHVKKEIRVFMSL